MRAAFRFAAALTAILASAGPVRAEVMDTMWVGGLSVDRLEARLGEGSNVGAWDAEAWIGGDTWKFVAETEGEYAEREKSLEKAEHRLYARRMISEFFDARGGLRYDSPAGPDRGYVFLGFQGLAPQWVEVDGDLFVSEKGDLSARFGAEYELLLTNRLILQPEAEIELALTDDREIGLGQGITGVEAGVRLIYELVDRDVAPYLGVHWERKLGETANLARREGEDTDGARFVIGLRLQF